MGLTQVVRNIILLKLLVYLHISSVLKIQLGKHESVHTIRIIIVLDCDYTLLLSVIASTVHYREINAFYFL